MSEWALEPSEKFERELKHYEKKHPNELRAMLDNLNAYLAALNLGVHPQFIQAGFIHHEPKGIKALDQRDG